MLCRTRKMTKICQKDAKINDFRGLLRESARKRAETPRNAPQARRRRSDTASVADHKGLPCYGQLNTYTFSGYTAWRRISPEYATAQPNRHCYALWAPFERN